MPCNVIKTKLAYEKIIFTEIRADSKEAKKYLEMSKANTVPQLFVNGKYKGCSFTAIREIGEIIKKEKEGK